jgi:hypothetical protein
MKWYGVDCDTNVFYFQAHDETEAIRIAQKDFGSSKLVGHLPIVLGTFSQHKGGRHV